MRQSTFYTLCIPFIDIYITDPGVIDRLNIQKNEMTMYSLLSNEQQEILHQYVNPAQNMKAYYGGMSYNTCAEIAKHQKNVTAVFIGPFSTDEVTKRVFGDAIAGQIENLSILPEFIESESGRCFVIPNGSNRAMITKANTNQKLTKSMTDTFLHRISQEDTTHKNALYIAGYTVETSTEALLYLIEEKKKRRINCLTIINLADPGVIDRAYELINKFITESDWVIGNREEYRKLITKTTNKDPTKEEIYRYIEENIPNGVLTAGSEEAVVIYREGQNKKRISIQPKQIRVVNATGAGDVFAANFFSSILEDQIDIERALRTAVQNTNKYLQKISDRDSR